MWVRPLSMFTETVELEDGQVIPSFQIDTDHLIVLLGLASR